VCSRLLLFLIFNDREEVIELLDCAPGSLFDIGKKREEGENPIYSFLFSQKKTQFVSFSNYLSHGVYSLEGLKSISYYSRQLDFTSLVLNHDYILLQKLLKFFLYYRRLLNEEKKKESQTSSVNPPQFFNPKELLLRLWRNSPPFAFSRNTSLHSLSLLSALTLNNCHLTTSGSGHIPTCPRLFVDVEVATLSNLKTFPTEDFDEKKEGWEAALSYESFVLEIKARQLGISRSAPQKKIVISRDVNVIFSWSVNLCGDQRDLLSRDFPLRKFQLVIEKLDLSLTPIQLQLDRKSVV